MWGIVVPNVALGLAGLGEMDLQEAAVAAVQADERIDRLDHAGAGRPAAADAGGKRDDGDLAALARPPHRARSPLRPERLAGLDQLGVVDVADIEVDRQPVPGQADPAALKVVAQLFVLDGVEAVVAADPRGLRVPLGSRDIVGGPRDREEMIDRRAEDAEELAGLGATVGEVVDVGPAMVGKRRSCPRRSSGGPGACSRAAASSLACPESSVANVPWALMRKS